MHDPYEYPFVGMLDVRGIDEYITIPLNIASDDCEAPVAAYPPMPVEDMRILQDREGVRRFLRSGLVWSELYMAPVKNLAKRLGII